MAEELVFGLKEQDSDLWLTKWEIGKVSLWKKRGGGAEERNTNKILICCFSCVNTHTMADFEPLTDSGWLCELVGRQATVSEGPETVQVNSLWSKAHYATRTNGRAGTQDPTGLAEVVI